MLQCNTKAEISGVSMCYFLCCCKGDDDEDKDNEINLFKLDEKSLEQLEKTEIEHTGRVQNNYTQICEDQNI